MSWWSSRRGVSTLTALLLAATSLFCPTHGLTEIRSPRPVERPTSTSASPRLQWDAAPVAQQAWIFWDVSAGSAGSGSDATAQPVYVGSDYLAPSFGIKRSKPAGNFFSTIAGRTDSLIVLSIPIADVKTGLLPRTCGADDSPHCTVSVKRMCGSDLPALFQFSPDILYAGPNWDYVLTSGSVIAHFQCEGGAQGLINFVPESTVPYDVTYMSLADHTPVVGTAVDQYPYALFANSINNRVTLVRFDHSIRKSGKFEAMLDLPPESTSTIISLTALHVDEEVIVYVGTKTTVYQYACREAVALAEAVCSRLETLSLRADALLAAPDRLLAISGTELHFIDATENCDVSSDNCMGSKCAELGRTSQRKNCGICRTIPESVNDTSSVYVDACVVETKCDLSRSLWLDDQSAARLPATPTCPTLHYEPQSVPILFIQERIGVVINIYARVQCKYNGQPLVRQWIESTGKTKCTIVDSEGFGATNVVNLEVTSEVDGFTYFLPVRFVSCGQFKSCEKCVGAHHLCRWSTHAETCFDSGTQTVLDERSESTGCPSFTLQSSDRVKVVSSSEGSILQSETFPILMELQRPILHVTDLVYLCVRKRDSLAALGVVQPNELLLGFTIQPEDLHGIERTEDYTIVWSGANSTTGTIGTLKLHAYMCTRRRTCGECLFGLDRRTSCSWCGACFDADSSCGNAAVFYSADQARVCPRLSVTSAKPDSAPVAFDQILLYEVMGSYLTTSTDLAILSDAVRFGDIVCPIDADNTDLATFNDQRIVCRVPESTIPSQPTVTVVIEGSIYETSFEYFEYDVQNISRSVGPMRGNTSITVWTHGLHHLTRIDHLADHLLFLVGDSNNRERLPLDCSRIVKSSSLMLTCLTRPANNTGVYTLTAVWKYPPDSQGQSLNVEKKYDSLSFWYGGNPAISDIQPRSSVESGLRDITIMGENFNSVIQIQLYLYNQRGMKKWSEKDCVTTSSTKAVCHSPRFNHRQSNTTENATVTGDGSVVFTRRRRREIDGEGLWQVGVLMDGLEMTGGQTSGSEGTFSFIVQPDPAFNASENAVEYFQSTALTLKGTNLNLAATPEDYTVFLGGEQKGLICTVSVVSQNTLFCKPPAPSDMKPYEGRTLNMIVSLYDGRHKWVAGTLQINTVSTGIPLEYWLPAVVGAVVLIFITLVGACFGCRKAYKYRREYHAMEKRFDQMEVNVRNECKQAFAELQTQISHLNVDETGIPFWDFKNYSTNILFPGRENHASLHKYQNKSRSPIVMKALQKFEALLYNEDFLVTLIHTLEEQNGFSSTDRVEVAALLMMILQPKMEYVTRVLKVLLQDLIVHTIKKKYPKLLLRRSESVVEKLLAHWIAISLYQYLQDFAGKPLFLLMSALKQQIEKGPVDMLTHEARYSLSEDRLLREEIEYSEVMLHVIQDNSDEVVPCSVISCDSISQVKEKVLCALHKNSPYAQRPKAHEFYLEWFPNSSSMALADEDISSRTEQGWKRVNTVGHYNIPNDARVRLAPKTATTGKLKKSCEDLQYKSGSTATLQFNGVSDSGVHNAHVSKWHLSKHRPDNYEQNPQNLIVRELFLPRLVVTKGILQTYVEDLFRAILTVNQHLPPTIKWLFDFMDEQAQKHNLSSDHEVTHTWKNNSLHLRFWVNIIKNPNFVFDVHKDQIVDSSLTVVASTLIDSCAPTEPQFGKVKDAPVNKLLFAKNRPEYREMVNKFYADIAALPPVRDEDMSAYLGTISKKYPREFQKTTALKELYWYAEQYHDQILKALSVSHPKLCFPFNEGMERPANAKPSETTTDEDDCTSTRGLMTPDKGGPLLTKKGVEYNSKKGLMSTLL